MVSSPRMTSGSPGRCSDCLGKIPYASLISFLLTGVGVGLFCSVGYKAINISVQQWNKAEFTQQHEIPFLDKVKTMFVLLSAVMFVLTLVLLIVGCLATGSTRQRLYSGWRARLGGRISCACLLFLTYAALLLWLPVFALVSVLSCLYLLLRFICASVMSGHEQRCLDFTGLAPLFGQHIFAADASQANDRNPFRLCDEQAVDMCQLMGQASDWYLICWPACLLVILGLVNYLVCLSANYAHIKDGYKYHELEELRCNEENELIATYGQHSVYRG